MAVYVCTHAQQFFPEGTLIVLGKQDVFVDLLLRCFIGRVVLICCLPGVLRVQTNHVGSFPASPGPRRVPSTFSTVCL